MNDSKIIVSTTLGDLEGAVFECLGGEKIFSFLGVPYAKPPIGDRRFQNPEPMEAWEGLKAAKDSPPTAPMLDPFHKKEVRIAPGCSEDCLYLNIYTPVFPKPGMKIPVMVFLHGGCFTFGSSNKDQFGPDYLVPQGIILAGVNFRLGPLGFLSLDTKECSGNYGLKDQVMALRWIQTNISAFGGDSCNTTILGLSSGAMSVHYHMMSPLSRGLFRRAIIQSSTALSRWALLRYPRQTTIILAKRMGFQSENLSQVLQFLKNAPFEDILIHSKKISHEIEGVWATDEIFDRGFGPVVEPFDAPGAFMTITPQEAVDLGLYADVQLILGCAAQEAILFLPHENFLPAYATISDFQMMLPKEIAAPLDSEIMLKAAKMVKHFYFPDGVTQAKYVEALTALHYFYNTFCVVRAHSLLSSKKAPHFLYLLSASRKISSMKAVYKLTSVPGTCHAEDMDYLFFMRRWVAPCPIKVGTDEHRVQKLMLKLWTDFAKNGVPSTDWPPATKENNFSYADLHEKMDIKENFGGKHIAFWHEIYQMLREEKLKVNSKLIII